MRIMKWIAMLVVSASVGSAQAESAASWQNAFQTLDDGPQAREIMGRLPALERDVLEWALLRAGSWSGEAGENFGAALELLNRHPDWPRDDRVLRAVEKLIAPEDQDAQVLDFLLQYSPRTAHGFGALLRRGDGAPRAAAIADVWPRLRLSDEDQAALLAEFAPMLVPHYYSRADYLLWERRSGEAARMVPLLTHNEHADAAARLAYLTGADTAGALDTGGGSTEALAFARFEWLAQRGEYTAAARYVLDFEQDITKPAHWARWRLRLSRWAMRQHNGRLAYDLATNTGLRETDPAPYAKAQWLAGYIALAQLNAPQTALGHFANMSAVVRQPISLGRAWYWRAQSAKAAGDDLAAQDALIRAAGYPTSFYGQLALEEAALRFPQDMIDGRLRHVPLISDAPLVRELDIFAQGKARGPAFAFLRQIINASPMRSLEIAANRMLGREDYFLALKAGKAALSEGRLLAEALYPLHPLAALDGVQDVPLALAIARQESEFRTDAGSSAGALGLMQLMPATAEQLSSRLGLPYSQGNLLFDWEYNARLGTTYLEDLRRMFGDSPILIAAAYNAGPSRARQWIARNGDPRKEGTDPIAWIEAIPFDETRNYVMRVSEAIRPYEARLAGADPKRTMAEIVRGAPPYVRPRARPAGLGAQAPIAEQNTRPPVRP